MNDFHYLSSLQININNQILERHFEVNNNNEDPVVINKYYDNILASTNHVELLTNIEPEIEVGFFIANDHELYNLLYELSMINNNMYYESIINKTNEICDEKQILRMTNTQNSSPFRVETISRNNIYFKDELLALNEENSKDLNIRKMSDDIDSRQDSSQRDSQGTSQTMIGLSCN